MSLYEQPFNNILCGSKTIEIRLNDEKRRKVIVGDYIVFSRLPEQVEKLKVQVVELHKYPNSKNYTRLFRLQSLVVREAQCRIC
jgi:ASC-1-like (ASCH) protein